MTDQPPLNVRTVKRLLRRNVVGSHKKQVDTVKNWFATDEQGRAETIVRELIRGPDAPLVGYGGSRDNVRLTSMADAKEYIEERGSDLPWGLRDD